MSVLNDLGRKHGTDKSSDGKRADQVGRGHDYLRVYEKFLEPHRRTATRMLEIGVQRGSSVRMWRDYFEKATIFGLDIAESARNSAGDRIEIRLVDQSDAKALSAFAVANGPFDVIVEDGSHIWGHQITSLQTLLGHVRPGGVYIVEDLHTSYSPSFAGEGGPTAVDYLIGCFEKVIGDRAARIADPADAFVQALGDRVDYMIAMRRAAIFVLK